MLYTLPLTCTTPHFSVLQDLPIFLFLSISNLAVDGWLFLLLKALETHLPLGLLLSFKEFTSRWCNSTNFSSHKKFYTLPLTSTTTLPSCETTCPFSFFSFPEENWLCLGDCPCLWRTWQHIFPMAFCCSSRNSPADGDPLTGFQVTRASTLSQWHILLPLPPCALILLFFSFLSFNTTGCAWVTAHVNEGLGNTSSKMLSAAIQGIHQWMRLLH